MPQGVHRNVLTILDREVRARATRLVLAVVLAGLAVFLAELADRPPWGPDVERTLLLLAVGLVAGLAWAWWRWNGTGDSIRDRWGKWMQWAPSSERLQELRAKAEGRSIRLTGPVQGTLWGLAVVLNVLLFVGLWYAWPGVDLLALAVLSLDGLALGVLAADAAWGLQWTWRFRSALAEMVEEGELGVWGEI